jgi:hypothetical protein
MRRVVEATGGIPGADGRDKNGDFVIVLDSRARTRLPRHGRG